VGESLLYDSTAAGAPALPAVTLRGLRLELAAAGESAGAYTGVLLLYVGDMAQPRARVALTDLLRSGRRPLNIRRAPGDRVRLLLHSDGSLPAIRIFLEW
jgi:hypothetical protein